jgi:hypothetical protein
MLSPQDLRGTLANDAAGRYGVAGCHSWHNRGVGNTQVFDSVDLKITVYHRHWVTSHLGGTALMPPAKGSIPDEVLQRRPFQIAGHHLSHNEWAKCGGVADLTAEFDTGHQGIKIVWLRQDIGLDLNGIERICSRQTQVAPTLGPDDAGVYPP